MKLFIIAAFITCVLIALLISGCSDLLKGNDIKSFIPGVYTRHYKDEYTESDDTIVIHEHGTQYEVTRRSRQIKMVDGKPMLPRYILVKWTGVYNSEQQHLWLEPAGKAIVFDLEKKVLIIGVQPYKKLE